MVRSEAGSQTASHTARNSPFSHAKDAHTKKSLYRLSVSLPHNAEFAGGRMRMVDLRAEEGNTIWLRGLTGIASIASWVYSCGCLAYCIYLLLKVEPAILPSLNILDVQTGLVIILCSSAVSMVTGLAGACGSITLKKEPLLLHCCITTVECFGYLAAGTVALRNRVTVGSRLEMAFDEMLKDYITPEASDEIVHKLHTIQAVLRCCGKNGGQDFMQMERPHSCVRAVAQYGCLRAAFNLMASELYNQSCVGFAGAFLLLFSLFPAASLMTSLHNDS
ncbi:hypothetical protein TcWFU_004327 [Taenia crassiceps]|uniref:Tetraspanin n=1 Tax=Taenia crassiceps TaxID=6207 RepID=A0ABR4QQN8_9CEST